MPYWSFLLKTPSAKQILDKSDAERFSSAADLVPLAWLALFSASDIRSIVPRGESTRHLTLITSVANGCARLERRREILAEVLWPPLLEHVDLFVAKLKTLPPDHGIQVWLSELVYRWPDDAQARNLLTRVLDALDKHTPVAWDVVMDVLLAEREQGSIRARFDPDVAVMKNVGWFEGRPAPERIDALAPSFEQLEEAWAKLTTLGVGFTAIHLGIRAVALERIGEAPPQPEIFEALDAWDEERLTFDDLFQGRNLAFRRAMLAELVRREVSLERLPDEPDPQLRGALVAMGLHGRREATEAAVPSALRDSDVRVRIMLAFGYPPRDPYEDDEVAPMDAVWEALVHDLEPRVRWAAYMNPCCPVAPDEDPHPAIRALRKDASLLELLALAESNDPLALATALHRRNTPMLIRRQAMRSLGIVM